MEVIDTEIKGVKILIPGRFGDPRGIFCETYSKKAMAVTGLELQFVQDNHSISAETGTVRGLHFQLPPFAQDKLVRCVRGAILDMAVDIRRGSPTFGRHVKAVLSAENWKQMLVPAGFAHGFVTQEPGSEVIYKVTNYYSPQHDRGIIWNDPDLGIEWGIGPQEAKLSEKDKRLPRFHEAGELF